MTRLKVATRRSRPFGGVMIKVAALGGAALLSVGVLAGCSTSSGGSDDGSQSATQEGQQVVVGYSGYTVSNPYFAGLLKGLEDGAAKHGFKLITTNANGDVNQQVADVENLITQGADYIAINPADGTAIAPAVEAATKAGIPTIALADAIKAPVKFTIAPDQSKMGDIAADKIAEFLTAKYGSAKGDVVDITGLSGTVAAAQRDIVNGLKKYPNIHIIATADGGWDTAKSNTAMNDILQAHPKIDAVFAANDAQAAGVNSAIKSAGRFHAVGDPDHIYVIGADGAKPAIDAIRANVMDATVSQQPISMSEKMMDYVNDLVEGKSVDENIVWPVQYIDLANIDSEEVKKYGLWADQL